MKTAVSVWVITQGALDKGVTPAAAQRFLSAAFELGEALKVPPGSPLADLRPVEIDIHPREEARAVARWEQVCDKCHVLVVRAQRPDRTPYRAVGSLDSILAAIGIRRG